MTNVPMAITESSHPELECPHSLDLYYEHAHLDLTEDHVSIYLDMAVPLTSDSSPSSSHSQDEDATSQQATVPLLVDTPAPPDPLPEHVKDVEQSMKIDPTFASSSIIVYLKEVLTQLTSRLASQLNDLTIQVVKEDLTLPSMPLSRGSTSSPNYSASRVDYWVAVLK
ncbi:uncharacterized protein LOC135348936 isoform X1 [Halichondria panicea]|uniref:uncharacterized protein LOC135348936 isoform X1 n=1 Tax=Halichondria panicea TaxID=6063 RepID=UPI00312BA6ED